MSNVKKGNFEKDDRLGNRFWMRGLRSLSHGSNFSLRHRSRLAILVTPSIPFAPVPSQEREMTKTLMYRLFGLGRFHEPLATALQREGVVLLDEGIPGSVTYVNFRAPGWFSGWKRQWHTSSIALTATRLVATRYAATAIDVPVADDRFRGLNF